MKREEFKIKCVESYDHVKKKITWEWKPVLGYDATSNFFVYKQHFDWAIVHKVHGYAVASGLPTRRIALGFAKKIEKLDVDWSRVKGSAKSPSRKVKLALEYIYNAMNDIYAPWEDLIKE